MARLPVRGAPRLVVLSFLMLFTELALIRFTSAYIVYLKYFTNFVLLASFLGIGVGFLRAGARHDRSALAPFALLAVVVFVMIFPVRQTPGQSGPILRGLFGTPPLPVWVSLPLLFLAVTAAMACIGEGVARVFVRFDALQAYRLDILGSLLGIAAFTLGSFLHAGPIVWGLVIAAALAVTSEWPIGTVRVLALGAFVLLLVGTSVLSGDLWSPYYRIGVGRDAGSRIPITVNGLPHQSILPFRELVRRQPFYLYPYEHLRSRPRRVLIVGAGSGNDVAVALREGAGSVDAVEIDPLLQRLGRARHPDHPYADPRVRAIVDDGRAFLERTDARYDLIEFALPDSLTLVSGAGSLRLESYLFTREAFQTVRDHLAAGGVFSMYNYYRPDVFDRYAGTLSEVFGHAPCLDRGLPGAGPRRQAVLTIGVHPSSIVCTTRWQPTGPVPAPATDDYPFPYARSRGLPAFYLVSLLFVLLASAVLVRTIGGEPLRGIGRYADLFAMGAAFMLLETKNVVQFALLFGTTWLVNSLVFAGILLAVYLAVEVSRRVRFRLLWPSYAALVAALAVAWSVPQERLLSLAPVPRFVAAATVAFAPVFLANLVFAQRFRDSGSPTLAFGANLLGAMVGGVLEYGALIVGYRDLLIAVALLYGVAFWLQARGRAVSAGEREMVGPGEPVLEPSTAPPSNA